MKNAVDLLVIIVSLAFAVSLFILPARARQRNQNVNQAYPAFPFLFPALFAVIALQRFVDYSPPNNRASNGFVMVCCIFFVVFLPTMERRRRTPQPYKNTPTAVTVLFGILALVFAFLTFR